jgi:hypothetical protein
METLTTIGPSAIAACRQGLADPIWIHFAAGKSIKINIITYYFGCEHEGRGKKMVSRKIREE